VRLKLSIEWSSERGNNCPLTRNAYFTILTFALKNNKEITAPRSYEMTGRVRQTYFENIKKWIKAFYIRILRGL